MVEVDRVDTDVKNLVNDDAIVDSQLLRTGEPITVTLGKHVNGNPVTVDVQHFAAIEVNRAMTEAEQEQYGESELQSASVMVAAESGEASQEKVVDVYEGDVDDAVAALEYVVESGGVNVMQTANNPLAVENGELVPFDTVNEQPTADVEQ